MSKSVKIFIVTIIFAAGLLFIVSSFRKASEPPAVAEEPAISEVPVRVYGVIEPAGREVFVSPPMTKRVVEIYVREGQQVKQGQRLCVLEHAVEKEQVDLAEAKVALAQKALEISLDELKRTKDLYARRVDSEFRYTKALLQKEQEVKRLKVADHELEVAKATLEQTVMRAPVDGTVYKFDVRLGETLAAGDNDRIILGSPDLWVRLSVESFWRDRISDSDTFAVFDMETDEPLGTGTVVRQAPYMGRRGFRTEDLQERFDTKFQDVILALSPTQKDIPIGLAVRAMLQ